MKLVLSAWAAAAIATGAVAQNQQDVPFWGCIEATGEVFTGSSFGMDIGPLRATSSQGAICVGEWDRLDNGSGAASFSCTDGRLGVALFDWFDEASGTAVGEGSFTNGEVARFWSGTNLEAYFREVGPEGRAGVGCGLAEQILNAG